MTSEALIQLTAAAVTRVRALTDRAERPVAGLRIGIKSTGCSGHSYVVEYADQQLPMEEVIECDGVRLFVDPLAMMYLAGAKMDYVEGKLQSGFIFENPNEKGRCGCGESFQL